MMRHHYDIQDDQAVLLRGLGRLWLAGASLDWDQFQAVTLEPTEAQAAASSGDRAPDPGGVTEQQIAGIFRELLRVERVGLHDSFFEIGGNSLKATQLVRRVFKAFGVNLPLRSIYKTPTAAGLAAIIEERSPQGRARAHEPPPPPAPVRARTPR
jgi:acyl carrier protein